MDNNENIPDIEQEEQIDETLESSVQQSDETKDWEAEAKKWKAIAIRKSKQAENKPKAEDKPVLQEQPVISRDEVVLLAKGYDEEALAKLKAIATVNKVSLKEAESDEMFVAWKEKKESDAKAEKAKLSASKGSGRSEGKKSFYDSTLSAEEHKRMFMEKYGK